MTDTPTTPALEPCSWCDGDDLTVIEVPASHGHQAVFCGSCFAASPWGNTRDKAIENHNTRFPSPEVAALRAEVEAARDLLRHIRNEAWRYADMYPQGSDGRNTFVIFAEMVANKLAALQATPDA